MSRKIVYAQKDFTLIGKMLVNNDPDVAQDLFSQGCSLIGTPPNLPISRMLEFLPCFFEQYSLPTDTFKHKYDTETIKLKRVFAASMVQIYHPEMYIVRPDLFQFPKKGFVKTLGYCLRMYRNHTSTLIREVITAYKVYDEFKAQTNTLTKILLKHGTE